MSNKSQNKFLKICCHVIFIIYFVLLIKIVLFKYRGLITTFENLIAGKLSGFHSYNIIPFQSILEFTKLMFSGHFFRGFNNIVGNVFIFSPFGYFMPLLYKKCQNVKIVILSGFLVSLFFEICQYFLYLGSADIDDIILNLLGIVLGFLFFKIFEIIYKRQATKYGVTIILSILGFMVAGYLAVDYFGIMFRNVDRNGQTDSSNDLPIALIDNIQVAEDISNDEPDAVSDNEFDIWGDIMSFDDSSVTINKTKVEDLEDGVSIATVNVENPDLQTVYLTETTKYTQKDIYDANGDRVETREAAGEDLKIDKHINIKGYQSDNKFFATEIVINNYLFM
ncbi:MAG: VanZ family protein [Lachnospiraceae bacterium]|nr:VanZ family protein [Lachnospiraceae bacterium]